MLNQFDYFPSESIELLTNIKWTILSHVKFIINYHKIFNDEFSGGLSDSHFWDGLSRDYQVLPAFGIDYVGKRVATGEAEHLLVLTYVGKNIEVKIGNNTGVETEIRKLLKIHELIDRNFNELSRNNQFEVYNFSSNKTIIDKMGIIFGLNLLESSIERFSGDGARQNSIDFTFGLNIYTSN